MDEKILRETFDHNLNESFRLKQLENGLSVFTVIKTTQTNLVTKSMEKPLFAHIRVTSRCNLKCASTVYSNAWYWLSHWRGVRSAVAGC